MQQHHLVESELFGHEKGAYSSAESAKPGLFELADQGTLFLDEIGELEPRMQVKLLRVLDGAPYYRLGGTKKITVNVRVVAATNQDLGEMVRKERFRPDLYHRLSEIHLEVPPLRRRRSDILPLAEYFLTQLKQGKRLSHEVREALLRYHWPGNARELRNVLLRAAVAAPGEEIVAYHLPKQFAGVPVAETPASELKALAGLLGIEYEEV
jgi:transcriptional regulator with GAF, ATPase, and Fis domain